MRVVAMVSTPARERDQMMRGDLFDLGHHIANGEADALSTGCQLRFCSKEHGALHGRGHGAADQAIKPVVITSFRSDFPFVDSAAATFGLHPILGSYMFSQKSMRLWLLAE